MRARYLLAEHLRGRGTVLERLRWLQHTQTLPHDELLELQQQKLRDTIAHAYHTVPYYRSLMDERGIAPTAIGGTADLVKLPLLTRAKLLANQDALLSSEADRKTLKQNFSSGSTGQRAAFYQDADFRLWMRAHQLRTYAWCGKWEPGERFVLLWGSEIFWSSKIIGDLIFNFLTSRREFNTFRLSRELVTTFVDKLARFDPVLISSYSNALHLVAREAERCSLRLPSLRAVQATSEPLVPEMRATMERAFGCEIFDKYGSRETNVVSHECPSHDSMLIQVENVVVETLREDGTPCAPGEPGRVVLTTLNNRSMPLIRYETSDIAALLSGPGRGPYAFPRMTAVHGRRQDLIVTPRGDLIDSYFFSYLLMQFSEIDWFQVVQSEPERLLFRVVSSRGLPPQRADEIAERVRAHTGYPFRIEYEFLDDMPWSSTGKFRLCVSELPEAISVRNAIEAV